MAEPDQFALHAPVAPGGVLGGHAHHEVLDGCCGGWTSGSAACGVVPLSGDQPAVPGQDRGSSDREDLGPPATWHPTGTRRPTTPGQQACNAPERPVGATQRSRVVIPAVRRPCSGLAAPPQQSDRADSARAGTRSTAAAFDDDP